MKIGDSAKSKGVSGINPLTEKYHSQRLRKLGVLFVLLITILLSIVCLKKYSTNSNVISYDLSSFSVSEGFNLNFVDNCLVIAPNPDREKQGDFCASTPNTLLAKGNYSIGIEYSSDGYNVAYMQAGDSLYEEILLPAGEQTVFFNFTLDQPVEDARVRFYYYDGNSINIKTMILQSDRPIITDWILVFALLWGVVLAGLLYAKVYFDGALTKEHLYEIGFVVLVAMLSIPYTILVNKGIVWGIDTAAHNMRIEGIKDALLGGQFPVVIAPSMCNGYGSIAPVMYPSLFLYPFAFLRILGVSPVMTYKVAHIIINLFMCSTCYVCVKKITRSKQASSLALIAFAFSKFHLTLIGARDWTYGMGIAIIFLFIVIIGIYEIFFGKYEEWPYLTIGMWGIMNSHIITSLFAVFIVGVFSLVFINTFRKERNRLISMIKAVVTSCPICLYRIYTFLDAYINNDLNTGTLNLNEYQDWVYPLSYIVRNPLMIFPYIVVAFSTVFLVLCYKKIDSKKRGMLIGTCVINAVCALLMMKVLPWERILSVKLFSLVFGYIQFPERLLQMAMPMSVIILGMITAYLLDNKKKDNLRIANTGMNIGLALIICVVFSTAAWSYDNEINELNTKDNIFTDKVMGDVFSFPGMDDYVPEGENGESYGGRTPYFSSENVSIEYDSYEKNGVNIAGAVTCKDESGYIDFPVFGYKGYECFDSTGKKYETGVGEHHRLRVYLEETEEPAYIMINYRVPKLYTVLQVLSYASLFLLITFNKDFLARTKTKIHYYEFLGRLIGKETKQEV